MLIIMRSLAALLSAFALLASLAGCGLLPEQEDETAGWSANKLYSEAKGAMSDGTYDKAIKYFEKLEARYPYGRYAQQAQLEVAYAYFKQMEPASAIAA
jgi:outer membrane protein assembly factor BamD